MLSLVSPLLYALAGAVLLPVVIIVLLRHTLERRWPMTPRRRDPGAMNILACLVWNVVTHSLAPGVAIVTVLAINHLGGGWIALPGHGMGLVPGFIVYALSADLAEYLFHRAEHAVPMMWSMHSLHHSDSHFDASTSILHHWGAPLLHSLLASIPLALLFKVPGIDLTLWGVMSLHVYIMHGNLKWDFGRFWWLLSSPIYHRTHHSALPEHFDCNYASLFPVWDVVFGSARRIESEALPPVGLGEGNEARGLSDLLLWPFRGNAAVAFGVRVEEGRGEVLGP